MASSRPIRDHVIVDGSNIATEGRTLPSLIQLDEAVRAFLEEHPGTLVTVVVDATFQHRIDAEERKLYEEAVLAGEIVAPPAGAIGRGDAFIAAAAAKADATVLSNDSFQELHGEHPWLFDEGRLIGGKPVDGVGWVFVPRTPVRGSVSRKSQREARSGRGRKGRSKPSSEAERAKVAEAIEAEVEARRARGGAPPESGDDAPDSGGGASDSGGGSPKSSGGSRRKASSSGKGRKKGGAASSEDGSASPGGGTKRSGKAPEAINEPGPFLSFVSSHPVGTEVDATVDRFSSHGAYVVVDGAQCYVPLKSMADPPPRSAREVLTVGEVMTFVVDAFDTPRRSIDLAMPGHQQTGRPVGQPTPEEGTDMAPAKKKATAKKAVKKKAPAKKVVAKKAPAKKKATAKKTTAKKVAARKAPAKKKATAKKATAKKAPAKKKATAKKATAKKATTKRATAKKATAKKATARKATTKRATAKKAAAKRKAPARKAAARKRG